MEWNNVPCYIMQSIMREIYYGKNKEELNKFELENYHLYKHCNDEIFDKMFFIKNEGQSDKNIIGNDNVNDENTVKIHCYNNTNKKKIPYIYRGIEKYESFIPYENQTPFDTIKIDNLNDMYQLEDVVICEKYKNKYVILMIVSYEDEVGQYNNNNTPYVKKIRKAMPAIRILDENKQILFDKYFYHKTHTMKTEDYTVCCLWFGQYLFHLDNFIFTLYRDIVKVNINNFEIVENIIAYPQGIAAQNKTNFLYIGTHYGTVEVLNIKTLQPVKTILFYDIHNKQKINSVDIFSLKMVWDTLYVYAFEDWDGGIDRIITIDNVNDIQKVDNTPQLLYDSTELPSTHFSKCMDHYGKYLYISADSLNGTVILNRNTKRYVKIADTIRVDHFLYRNIFKVQDHYLIISRWYDTHNETELQIFDLEKDPLLNTRIYELKFSYKLIGVDIIENHICIQYLKDNHIVMEKILM